MNDFIKDEPNALFQENIEDVSSQDLLNLNEFQKRLHSVSCPHSFVFCISKNLNKPFEYKTF